jgi:cell division transport system permease protein
MTTYMIRQHLLRAWQRHWPLQMASVTVMTVVLLILNFMFLGFSTFNQMVGQWGRGLEMIVYFKEEAAGASLEILRQRLEKSGDFDEIRFISKNDATKKFLTSLGGESLDLMADPKWTSPIPASFELRLSEKIPMEDRVSSLQNWAGQLHGLEYIEDVFYGQGWVENFQRFLHSARGAVILLWALSLSVGLLIVGNCIRLSFLQRREEIEVLELVGATSRFIRMPFLLEGISIGLAASLLSLGLSFALHSALLGWLGHKLDFWMALQQVAPIQPWYIFANVLTGVGFGAIGAWNCVRKLNTGWAAVE